MSSTTLTVGLRFRYRDARVLRALAQRIRTGDLKGDIATFEQAATAAECGEPLEVHCTNLMEAQLVAGGYIRCGVTPTAIETLDGGRR